MSIYTLRLSTPAPVTAFFKILTDHGAVTFAPHRQTASVHLHPVPGRASVHAAALSLRTRLAEVTYESLDPTPAADGDVWDVTIALPYEVQRYFEILLGLAAVTGYTPGSPTTTVEVETDESMSLASWERQVRDELVPEGMDLDIIATTSGRPTPETAPSEPVPSDVADILGFVPETGSPIRRDTRGLLYVTEPSGHTWYLTECCGASATASMGVTVCRICFEVVDDVLGMTPIPADVTVTT